jgi:hypothetical protein
MATISEMIASGSTVLQARQAATQKRNADRIERAGTLQGASSILGEGIAGVVGGFFGKEKVDPIDADPAVVRAEQDAALAQSIQGLSTGENPLTVGTSEHMAAAGQAAQAAGRTDLALQFAEQSAALKVREDTTAVATAAAERKANVDAFNKLPTAVQLSIAANDPDRLVREQGLTPAQAKIVSADAADTLKTRQAKNQKALDELNTVHTTKSSAQDITQTTALLADMGISGATFENAVGLDNKLAATRFATFMDQQATAEIDAAAASPESARLTKAEVYTDILQELSAVGGIEGLGSEEGVFSGGVSSIDMDKLKKVIKARGIAAPVKPSSTSTRRTVVAQ